MNFANPHTSNLWRSQTGKDGCLKTMRPAKGGQRKSVANELRENLKHFVNSKIGSVKWRLDGETCWGNDRRQVKFKH